MRVSGSVLRRGGLGTVLLGAVVALAISTSGGTAAGWSAGASIAPPAIRTGTVTVGVSGLSSLSTTFSSTDLTATGAVTITDTGDVPGTLTTAVALGSGSSSSLASAVSLAVWPTTDAGSCASAATPATAWTGAWTGIPSANTVLQPGQSLIYCIRSHLASSALTTSGSITPTLTATMSVSAGAWTATASDSATQKVVADPSAQSPYSSAVLASGAVDYWRLGEPSGSTVYDWAGSSDALAGAGVSRGSTGAILADTNGASTFSGGGTGFVSTRTPVQSPNSFAIEAWFRTTTTGGGRIVGFSSSSTGNSSAYDRHVYLDTAGRVNFGVWDGSAEVVTSASAYNDGEWHDVVASLSPTAGMRLSVDDVTVGTKATTTADDYTGYWRIGGDNTWSGNDYFPGDIDDVAIYGSPLSSSTIDQHFSLSGYSTAALNAGGYPATVYKDDPLLYWRLGESSGTTAVDSGKNGYPGLYSGAVTLGARGGIAGTSDTAASFDGTTGQAASARTFTNPQHFSAEVWFKTTTTSAGTLIGFANTQTSAPGDYDRLIYMQSDGRLVFGTYNGGTNTATSTAAYNDGQWHAAVATQSSAGMVLYVDGRSVATNGSTVAQDYTGYWRVGGDTQWSGGSNYLQGTIDDVAVYGVTLTAAQVQQHYAVGAKSPPVAAFTSSSTNLNAAFDGSGSSDSDGSVTSWAWDYGDGSTGTGTTSSHSYADPGTYTVKLSVTDDDGFVGSVTHTVTVTGDPATPTRPGAPVASGLTSTSVTLTWRASTDAAGIASYQVLRDGTPVQTVTSTTFTDSGLSPSTTYSYTVQAVDTAGVTSPSSPATSVTTPFDSQGTYQVRSALGAFCIDGGTAPQSGTLLTLQNCASPATTQVWQLAPTDSGWSTVAAPGSPLVWDVVGGTGVTGPASVDVATGTGATNQQWQPVPVGNGSYKIVVRSSGLCLDVPSANAFAGAQLQQYACNGTAAQGFTMVRQ